MLNFFGVIGLLAAAVGGLIVAAVAPEMSNNPAIVIVPQLVLGVLVCGFGLVMVVICGAALKVIEAIDANNSTTQDLIDVTRGYEPGSRGTGPRKEPR